MAITDMTFEFVANMLKSTELKNMGVTNNKQDLANLINMVLIDLHNRFVLNKGIIDIPLEHNKYIYDLNDYFVDSTIPEETEESPEEEPTSLFTGEIPTEMQVGDEVDIKMADSVTYYTFSISSQSVLNWDTSVANENRTGVLRAVGAGSVNVKLIIVAGAQNEVLEYQINVSSEATESEETTSLFTGEIPTEMQVGDEIAIKIADNVTYYTFSISSQSILNWDISVADETKTGVLRAVGEGTVNVKLIIVAGAQNEVIEYQINVSAKEEEPTEPEENP